MSTHVKGHFLKSKIFKLKFYQKKKKYIYISVLHKDNCFHNHGEFTRGIIVTLTSPDQVTADLAVDVLCSSSSNSAKLAPEEVRLCALLHGTFKARPGLRLSWGKSKGSAGPHACRARHLQGDSMQ